jgi:hypothetical protein
LLCHPFFAHFGDGLTGDGRMIVPGGQDGGIQELVVQEKE